MTFYAKFRRVETAVLYVILLGSLCFVTLNVMARFFAGSVLQSVDSVSVVLGMAAVLGFSASFNIVPHEPNTPAWRSTTMLLLVVLELALFVYLATRMTAINFGYGTVTNLLAIPRWSTSALIAALFGSTFIKVALVLTNAHLRRKYDLRLPRDD